ncbi:MAG: BamA/TamA family outer membrane protein, partial [Bacteroidota bacterium]
DSYLTSNLRGYIASRDINAYSDAPRTRDDRFDRLRTGEMREVRRGGSLSFGTQLERLGNVTVTGRLEHHHVYNIFNTPITNEEYDISSFRFATRIDTQDRYPYPTEGVNMDFSYESALVKTAGSVGFTKMLFRYEVAQTYAGRHTLRPRLVIGLGDDAVPTSEQFSLGGPESFYGYREDNARGRQILAASLEYLHKLSFRLFFDTYLKVRYDIGSIWLRPEEIRLIDLQHAVGVGLGFDTPVGPAEFAVGRSFYLRKDLLERPLALGRVVVSFSIGYPLD